MTYSKDIKQLVKARISVMPSNLKLSVGNHGTFSKEELIDCVEKENMVGKEVIRMQMDFIKALTSGRLMDTLNQ